MTTNETDSEIVEFAYKTTDALLREIRGFEQSHIPQTRVRAGLRIVEDGLNGLASRYRMLKLDSRPTSWARVFLLDAVLDRDWNEFARMLMSIHRDLRYALEEDV